MKYQLRRISRYCLIVANEAISYQWYGAIWVAHFIRAKFILGVAHTHTRALCVRWGKKDSALAKLVFSSLHIFESFSCTLSKCVIHLFKPLFYFHNP
jgi:hypothetical protein